MYRDQLVDMRGQGNSRTAVHLAASASTHIPHRPPCYAGGQSQSPPCVWVRVCVCVCVTQNGVEKLVNLKVLLMSNNKVSSWGDVERLAALPSLEDLLLVGNPLYNDYKDRNELSEYRVEVGEDVACTHTHGKHHVVLKQALDHSSLRATCCC